MIGAPDIDQEVVSPIQLVAMIGNVRREIRVLSVLFPDDAILVIPEGR